mgnify:CR=1 FL=1
MRVVLDTNVLLVSLPKISPYCIIFENLIPGDFELLVTGEIIHEYKEVIGRKTTKGIAENISELLAQLDNVKLVNVFYQWNLIDKDPDDNKFVDCAISGNASFIVTNDRHFEVLKEVPFPKMDVLRIDEYLERQKKLK